MPDMRNDGLVWSLVVGNLLSALPISSGYYWFVSPERAELFIEPSADPRR